jgi:hypothetical protein
MLELNEMEVQYVTGGLEWQAGGQSNNVEDDGGPIGGFGGSWGSDWYFY